MKALLLAIAIAAAGVLAWAGDARAVVVRIAGEAACDAARITVGDVAVIDTPNAAERARLAGVVVAYAPAGESSTQVSSDDVREALRGAGINVAALTISGASVSHVRRAAHAGAREAAAESLREAAAAVEAWLAASDESARYAVTDVAADYPAGAGPRPVIVAMRAARGSSVARFDVASAAEPAKVIGAIRANVTKTVPAVVTRRRIIGGHVIRPEDVEVKYVGEGEGVRDLADVVGRRARFTIPAAKAVEGKELQNQEVVHRGDEVMLAVEGAGMTVTVKTTALESAAQDDVVRLRRAGDRKEFLARVTGAGRATPIEAAIEAPAPAAIAEAK